MGFPDRAENLVQEMKERGLNPSGFELRFLELRFLVYGYGHMGSLEDMKRCVVQMEKDGFDVDTVCFNKVLSSFGSQNNLSDMLSWLKKMRSSSIFSSIRTYNSALNSCPSVLFLLRNLKNVPLSIKELVDNLNKDEADLILELVKSPVLGQAMEWSSSAHRVFDSATVVCELKLRFDAGKHGTPSEILMLCSTRGESPVKGLVKEMMIRMKCRRGLIGRTLGVSSSKEKYTMTVMSRGFQHNSLILLKVLKGNIKHFYITIHGKRCKSNREAKKIICVQSLLQKFSLLEVGPC